MINLVVYFVLIFCNRFSYIQIYQETKSRIRVKNLRKGSLKNRSFFILLFFRILFSCILKLLLRGEEKMNEPLQFKVKNIDGEEVDLSIYKGKTVMIVNVASKCGLTPQYKGLQALYEKYQDKGFVILGFPSNDFLWQEPGSDQEIKQFCELNYKVTFPLFSKIRVKKGKDQAELYKYLTSPETNPGFDGDIEWNFQKFLINKEGKVVKRYSPRTTPEEIEKELPNYL